MKSSVTIGLLEVGKGLRWWWGGDNVIDFTAQINPVTFFKLTLDVFTIRLFPAKMQRRRL